MIDLKILNESILFWEHKNFKRIEVPWIIPSFYSNLTSPVKNDSAFSYVGSAEQSFLYLIDKCTLLTGSYQSLTPCFREENEDYLHKPYFLKNELINFNSINGNEYELMNILKHQKIFLEYIGFKNIQVEETLRSNSFDIISYDILTKDGIELGSYGIREFDFVKYVYGTACAEPRTSTLLKKEKK